MTEQDPIELIRQAIAGELQTTVTEALQQTEQVEQGEPSAQSEAPQAPQPGPVMPTRSPSMPAMPAQKSSLVNSFESTPTGLNPTGGRSDGPLSTYKHGGEHKKTKEKVERNHSIHLNLVQREDKYIKDKLDAGEWDPIGSTAKGIVNAAKATGTLDNMKNWLINKVSPGPYPTGPQAISHVYKSIKDPQGLQYVDRPANRSVDPNAFQMPLNPNDPLYNQKANPELYNLPDNQNPDKVLRSDYRMYNQFLGTGYDNDLPESKFKPSKSDDPNAKYYSAAQYYGDPQTLLDRMVRSRGQNDPEGSSYLPWEESELDNLKSKKGTWSRGMGVNSLPFSDDPGTTDTFHPMENWTMGAGEDEHGKYMSIYDKYDFKSEKLNSLGEPFEIYDRIHYTTDKDGNRKYKEVKRNGGLKYEDGGLKYDEGGPKKKLKKGTNVKQLQNFLIKKGYDLGAGEGKAITKGVGSFGPKTRAALAAYNKTQSFNTVKAVVPFPTDIIPTNVKEFVKSTVLPGWAYNMLGDLDEENLTTRQRSKLTQTVDEALKENKSQLGYKDNRNMKAYDEFGYSDMGNTSKFFDVVKKSLTSPAYNLKTTIGRANIIETPEYYDDEGNVIPSQRFVSDEYDFNDSKEAADRTFTEKWTDILGAGSFQAGMRAIGRNYGNTQPKNTMIRVQEEGGLRKKKKKARQLREDKGVRENSDGTHSTHLMVSDIIGNPTDEYKVWPSIYADAKNQYSDQTYEQARDRNEVFTFKNKRRAGKFAAGSWKKGKDKREAMREWRKSRKK